MDAISSGLTDSRNYCVVTRQRTKRKTRVNLELIASYHTNICIYVLLRKDNFLKKTLVWHSICPTMEMHNHMIFVQKDIKCNDLVNEIYKQINLYISSPHNTKPSQHKERSRWPAQALTRTMRRLQNIHKNKNMTQRQPGYNGSKKQKTKKQKNEITLLISKSQDQDRFGPTSERRGSVPDRHDTPIELEPTRIRAFITVVCCVSCAAAINSSIQNRHLRLELQYFILKILDI